MDSLQEVTPQQEEDAVSVIERSKMCIGSWKSLMLPNNIVTGCDTVKMEQSATNSGTLERAQLVTNTTLRMTQGSVSHVHKLYTYICMHVRYSHSYTVTVHACGLSHSK